MKQFLFFLALFYFSTKGFAQIYYIDNEDKKTIQTCRGNFYDSDLCTSSSNTETTNYCNNENFSVTFCSGTGKPIRASFLEFETEANYDFLKIYDGPNTSSPLLADLSGVGVAGGAPFQFTSTGSCLTFVFTSDGSGTRLGWSALLGCEPTNCNGNSPASDNCATATTICDLNGYCGSTNGWYTPDNRDLESGNPASGIFCGSIENNSWMQFTASASNATFDVTSSNCADPASGIQMQILSTTNCTNFTSVSNCVSQTTGSGSFTMNTNVPLNIGQTYYIMVDGYAGNACDYVIKAQSGVQVLTFNGPPGNKICTGQTTTLSVSGYQTGSTISWTADKSGAISGSSNGASITAAPTGTTVYTVTVVSPLGCKTQVQTFTLSVDPNPIASATSNAQYCDGDVINLLGANLGVGSPSYSWTGPGSYQSNLQNPSLVASAQTAGIYTLTTTSGICTSTATTAVKVNPNPTLSMASNLTVCEASLINVQPVVSGGSIYNWTGPNGYTSNLIDLNIKNSTLNTAGVYTLTVTNSTTNCKVSKTITLTVNNKPLSDLKGVAKFCTGTSTTLSASASLPGAGTSMTYQWLNNGIVLANASGNTYTVNSAGTYQVIVTNQFNCTDTSVKVVVVENTLPLLAGPTAITPTNCNGSTGAIAGITLTGNAPYTFVWTNASNNVISTVNAGTGNPSLNNLAVGTYSLTVTDANGCVKSLGNMVVANFAAPAAPLIAQPVTVYCQGATVVPLTVNPANSGGIINWYSSSTLNPLIATGTSYSPTIPSGTTGTFTYYVTETNNGCEGASATISITIHPKPQVSVNATVTDVVCGEKNGAVKGVQVSGGTPQYTYSWVGSNGTVVANTSDLINVGMDTYTLTVTDANNCTSASASYTVGGSPNVVASFVPSTVSGYSPLPVNFNNTSFNASSYTWDFGDLGNSINLPHVTGSNNIDHTYNYPGTFQVVLVARSGSCTDTARLTIIVEVTFKITIPNIFTPNNDGSNDYFSINADGLKSIEVDIFNRWGQKIYSMDSINKPWNGNIGVDQPADDGVYYYMLKALSYEGKEVKSHGNLTLIR